MNHSCRYDSRQAATVQGDSKRAAAAAQADPKRGTAPQSPAVPPGAPPVKSWVRKLGHFRSLLSAPAAELADSVQEGFANERRRGGGDPEPAKSGDYWPPSGAGERGVRKRSGDKTNFR